MDMNKLDRGLMRFRFISIIAVISAAFGSLLMFVIGATKVSRAYIEYVSKSVLAGADVMIGSKVAIVYLIQAIDAFLIAIGLMIFGGGIYNLFLRPIPENQRKLFGLQSIAHLKSLLAELIVVILIVKFLEDALHSEGGYNWNILVLPVGVLLIAIAIRILRFRSSDH